MKRSQPSPDIDGYSLFPVRVWFCGETQSRQQDGEARVRSICRYVLNLTCMHTNRCILLAKINWIEPISCPTVCLAQLSPPGKKSQNFFTDRAIAKPLAVFVGECRILRRASCQHLLESEHWLWLNNQPAHQSAPYPRHYRRQDLNAAERLWVPQTPALFPIRCTFNSISGFTIACCHRCRQSIFLFKPSNGKRWFFPAVFPALRQFLLVQ